VCEEKNEAGAEEGSDMTFRGLILRGSRTVLTYYVVLRLAANQRSIGKQPESITVTTADVDLRVTDRMEQV
jgi:hypothetical protein